MLRERVPKSLASPRSCYALLALGAVCYGFSAPMVKMAASEGIVAALYRVSVAFLCFSIPRFLAQPLQDDRRHKIGSVRAAIGGLLFSANIALFYSAVYRTTVVKAVLLANTSVLWVGFWAWLVERRPLTCLFWIGACTAIAGVHLLNSPSVYSLDIRFGTGDALALAAGLFYAAYIVVTASARKNMGTVSYLWLSCFVATVVLASVAVVSRLSPFAISWGSCLCLVSVAVVSQFCGSWLIVYAQKHVRPASTALILLVEPLTAAVLAAVLFAEVPHLSQLVGMVLLLAGILLGSQAVEMRSTVPSDTGNAR